MTIKYQVFLSSTYTDLIEERRAVLDILLKADCIPAGMENFVAQDEEQFNVIKKVIDLCDYYVLIIGKRYGSINPNTGKSYTEMEYDYAISKKIPVLVFALDISSGNDSDEDDIKKGKLAEFKKRAMTNRLASVWKQQSDLVGSVAVAIMTAKTEFKRPGWHRGSDEEKDVLLNTIKELRSEIESMKSNNKHAVNLENDFYEKLITLHYTEYRMMYTLSGPKPEERKIIVKLSDLFKFISLRLTAKHTLNEFVDAISNYQSGYYVDKQDALIVKNKYEQLGLIAVEINKDNKELIMLTEFGKEMMNKLNA